MTTERKHIIYCVNLEVNMRSEREALVLKDKLSDFINYKLLPHLDELLEELNIAEEFHRIEEMDLNFNISEVNEIEFMEGKIGDQFSENIHQVLSDRITNIHNQRTDPLSAEQNSAKIFLYFLQNGVLPWYGRPAHLESLIATDSIKEFSSQKDFISHLKRIIRYDEKAVVRLINQFSDDFLIQLVSLLNPMVEVARASTTKVLKKLDGNTRLSLLIVILALSIEQKEQYLEDLLSSLVICLWKSKSTSEKRLEIWRSIANILNSIQLSAISTESILYKLQSLDSKSFMVNDSSGMAEDLGVITSEKSSDRSLSLSPDEEYRQDRTELVAYTDGIVENQQLFSKKIERDNYLKNAGLILLHPFFKNFLIVTGIADNQGRISNEHRDLAVQVLHYLATGKENVFEYELILEKFICGIPINWPVQKQSFITEAIKAEAETLLKDVIKKWPALKNTSPDGLREGFFNREGKLIHENNQYRLIVERKAQDILLDRLPWNLSMIKLPWHSDLLIIEW